MEKEEVVHAATLARVRCLLNLHSISLARKKGQVDLQKADLCTSRSVSGKPVLARKAGSSLVFSKMAGFR
jgi:hypothetical protein